MTNQRPAEGLRDMITHIVAVDYLDYAELGITSKSKKQVDEIMELVTAYAATVEREAADQAYMQALKDDVVTKVKRLESIAKSSRDDVRRIYDEIMADPVIAALQGPIQDDSPN